MSDLVVVGNYDSIYDATAAKSFVESAGIFCELKNEFHNQTLRMMDVTGSAINIMVRKEDSAQAIQALLDHKMLHEEDLGPDKNMEMVGDTLEESPVKQIVIISEKGLQLIAFIAVIIALILIIADGTGNFKF